MNLYCIEQENDSIALLLNKYILWWISLLNVFNSDPIYYDNHLFVNIYAFIQFNIVRAAWSSGHRLLGINHYTGRDWLPGVWQTAASL